MKTMRFEAMTSTDGRTWNEALPIWAASEECAMVQFQKYFLNADAMGWYGTTEQELFEITRSYFSGHFNEIVTIQGIQFKLVKVGE